MKRITSSLTALMAVVLLIGVLLSAGVLYAQSVYDRTVVALPIAGSVEWENDFDYSALELKRIWVIGNAVATNTVTIQRITSGGAYTQAVGSVSCTGGAGNSSSFTAAHLSHRDKLRFTSLINTNATLMVEFFVQQR